MRPVADRQILRGSPATLSYQFRDADGEPAAPSGTVTVGVTKADGTVVVAADTATEGDAAAPRTYVLAAQAELGLLTATWTVDGGSAHPQLVEVVGAYYFDVATARARETALNETTFPNSDLIRARREVEGQCELICGVAWVPRFRSVRINGSGQAEQDLPDLALRTIRSVTVDGQAWDAGALAALAVGDGTDPVAGIATRLDGGVWPRGRQNIVVEYEHGYDRPPADLVLAAIVHLRHQLTATRTGLTDRATQIQPVDGGTVLLATPGRFGFETGIPEVDAVYLRYDHKTPGIA